MKDGRQLEGKLAGSTRLSVGDQVSLPKFLAHQEKPRPKISPFLEQDIVRRVLYMDEDVLMIDKPSGLAVQGGSKTPLHLDLLAEGS